MQQKYIELLEKRIGQLEAVVSAAEQKEKAKDEEGKKVNVALDLCTADRIYKLIQVII